MLQAAFYWEEKHRVAPFLINSTHVRLLQINVYLDPSGIILFTSPSHLALSTSPNPSEIYSHN